MADCKKETYFVAFFIKLTIIFCVWTTHSMYETETHTKKDQEFIIYFYLLLPLSNSRYTNSQFTSNDHLSDNIFIYFIETLIFWNQLPILLLSSSSSSSVHSIDTQRTTTQTSWTWYFGHLGIKKDTQTQSSLVLFFIISFY